MRVELGTTVRTSDGEDIGASGGRHQCRPAAAGADIDQARASLQRKPIEGARGERVGKRLEHGLVHGNVIIPSGRLLVWLEFHR